MYEKIAEMETNGAGDGCVPAQLPSLTDSDDVLVGSGCLPAIAELLRADTTRSHGAPKSYFQIIGFRTKEKGCQRRYKISATSGLS
jgi:hypothetical protein